MKRSSATITAILVGILLTGAGVFVWLNTRNLGDTANPTSANGGSTNQLSRGYHLTKLMSALRDDEPERVLIAIQNDWELRATGGFITAFGEGELRGGRIENFRVVPSDFFDNAYSLAPPMPAGLADRITTPTLTMRDANWDVDFATTAATLSRYYSSATGITPDLVIAVTTKSAERILAHTGPLSFSVNGHTLEVTQDTVTDTLERYTDQEFRELGLEWETRKQVLSQFGLSLLPELHDLAFSKPFELLRTVNDLSSSYDLQAWSPKPELNAHLTALGAAQLVATHPTADALLIVDTNVGARKSNRVVEQRADYRVDLAAPIPTATLTLTYTHHGEYGPLISDYHDTVRILVPHGSSLVTSEGLVDVSEYARHNRAVFEGRHIVPPGQSRTISLTYTLGTLSPQTSIDSYRLLLERQPGSTAYPLTITLTDGSETAATETDLSHDRILRVEPK